MEKGMENFFKDDKFETDEVELVDDAMDNAFNILTGKFKYKTLFVENADRIPLPFDPYNKDIDFNEVIDLLIEHYTAYEWYERCAVLVKLKEEVWEEK